MSGKFEKKYEDFEAKPTKGGQGRYVFHIPKTKINFGLIDPDKVYRVIVIPLETQDN